MRTLLHPIIISTLLVICFNTLSAQQVEFTPFPQKGENQEYFSPSELPLKAIHGIEAAGDTHKVWVNYGRYIYNQGGTRSYFRNYLYPDSTVQVEFGTGYGSVWKHSFGEVIDPKSIWFKTESIDLRDTSVYTVDSVAFFYRYFRWHDQAPDTLRIQFYDNSKVRARVDPGWQSGASYANVNYDYQIRKGSEPTHEILYLLEMKDTAQFASQRRLAFDVNLPYDTGLFAATITFFPGHTANMDDTIDVYIDPLATNRVNAFLAYEFRDEVPNVLAGEFNNGLVVTQSVRYDYNSNGWRNRYQPGTAWASSSGIYHTDMEFKLIYTEIDYNSGGGGGNPDGIAEDGQENDISVFPIPAQDEVHVEFTHPSEWTTIEIRDLQGKVVATQSVSGTHNRINIQHLTSGAYMLSTRSTSNEIGFQKKLIVQ